MMTAKVFEVRGFHEESGDSAFTVHRVNDQVVEVCIGIRHHNAKTWLALANDILEAIEAFKLDTLDDEAEDG